MVAAGEVQQYVLSTPFAALSSFGTIARSNYNAAQFSLRQRFGNDLSFDFNYTFSHSLDNASGLQASTAYAAAFIVNALEPDQNYATSDFDATHIINANWVVGLPFGRGKRFLSGMNSVAEGISGVDLTGIFRWNSGLRSDAIRRSRATKLERSIKGVRLSPGDKPSVVRQSIN